MSCLMEWKIKNYYSVLILCGWDVFYWWVILGKIINVSVNLRYFILFVSFYYFY